MWGGKIAEATLRDSVATDPPTGAAVDKSGACAFADGGRASYPRPVAFLPSPAVARRSALAPRLMLCLHRPLIKDI